MIEIVTLTCPRPTGTYSMTLACQRPMTVPGPALSRPRSDLEKLTLMIASRCQCKGTSRREH